MNKPIKDLKAISRGQLIGKYSTCIAATILISTINSFLSIINLSSMGTSLGSNIISVLISCILFLLSGILVYGEHYFFLQVSRCNMPLSLKDLFVGLKQNTDKAILLAIPLLLPVIFLGIPFGIIEGVFDLYSLPLVAYVISPVLVYLSEFLVSLFVFPCYFLLCDNPELTCLEIIKKGIKLMKKQKGRLILTYLSLIPLLLLCVISVVGLLWFGVYLRTILANFYIDVIGEKPHSPYTTEPKDVNHVDCSI